MSQPVAVSETMETARRWNGYVCPDCRFVFRVPRDHDGCGIVCPSCRRILRLPTADDITPPLLAPSPTAAAAEEPPAGAGEAKKVKRRRRGKKQEESLDWEKRPLRFRKGENRQMRQMLIAGVILFGGIVAGVVYLLNFNGDKGMARSKKLAIHSVPVETLSSEGSGSVATPIPPTRAEMIADAERSARGFLEAKTIEALLPFVRHPELTEARMRKFYAETPLTAAGLTAFNSDDSPVLDGNRFSISVRNSDFQDRLLEIFETEHGKKVDWESWVGWSEIPWAEMIGQKPSTAQTFRVALSPVEYYNFDFIDDGKWQSYRLESPDREHVLFGYVEKGSPLDQSLRLDPDTRSVLMTVSLKFPEGATSANQVVIEKLLAKGWVMDEK